MHAGAAEVVPAVRVVQRVVAVHRLAAERQVLRADVDAVEHEVSLSLRQRLLLASVRSPRLRPLCKQIAMRASDVIRPVYFLYACVCLFSDVLDICTQGDLENNILKADS